MHLNIAKWQNLEYIEVSEQFCTQISLADRRTDMITDQLPNAK